MSIRLSIECYIGLCIASDRTGKSFSEIGNKAMRKFERLKNPYLVGALKNYQSDYKLMDKPTKIRFKPSLIEDKSPALIRAILYWYLKSSKVYPKPKPLAVSKADIDLMYQVPLQTGIELAETMLEAM